MAPLCDEWFLPFVVLVAMKSAGFVAVVTFYVGHNVANATNVTFLPGGTRRSGLYLTNIETMKSVV